MSSEKLSACCGAHIGYWFAGKKKEQHVCGKCGNPADPQPEALSDEEWCSREAKKYGDDELFAACRLQDGIAEGRRREREELSPHIERVTEITASITQREEAAAREMAEIWYESEIQGTGDNEERKTRYINNMMADWKQRKEGGG
jgi:hypothetical protein